MDLKNLEKLSQFREQLPNKEPSMSKEPKQEVSKEAKEVRELIELKAELAEAHKTIGEQATEIVALKLMNKAVTEPMPEDNVVELSSKEEAKTPESVYDEMKGITREIDLLVLAGGTKDEARALLKKLKAKAQDAGKVLGKEHEERIAQAVKELQEIEDSIFGIEIIGSTDLTGVSIS